MNEITLENYRCFRERQVARLAPLTLLVGENSTGKTSFLALIRALTDLAYRNRIPDFKEEPYDLGSFDEIVHIRSGRGVRAKTFEAGFVFRPYLATAPDSIYSYAFKERGTAPFPIWSRISHKSSWVEERYTNGNSYSLDVGTSRGRWVLNQPGAVDDTGMSYLSHTSIPDRIEGYKWIGIDFTQVPGSPPMSNEDRKVLTDLVQPLSWPSRQAPFASAPVRSKPRRTYDPSRPTRDPEGERVPVFLADLFSRDKLSWEKLKDRLERFGAASGLFDEISIIRLGKRGGVPFQIQFRKYARRRKGPRHNLIDVGYGVSQALPVIIELLRDEAANLFLLQQPEVHLHPRAQAALGSLFCQVAGPFRQLVVETHSDYLLDRVRMEVRDGAAGLKPDDVSILFFERTDLDVHIHSLEIDKLGNIVNAPDSYGNFFMDETARLLRL